MSHIELDHLMWGASSLEAGIAAADGLFGVSPAPGGVHPRLGTCNALLSLGNDAYLEVIAPDPDQDVPGGRAQQLRGLEAPALVTWAAAASPLSVVASRAEALGLSVRGPVPTERATPDGRLLRWELLFLSGHPFGGLVPFFIDWLDTPHPARTNPVGGRFERLSIRSPDADALNVLFDGLGLAVRATEDAEPGLSATIGVGSATVALESTAETISWPL